MRMRWLVIVYLLLFCGERSLHAQSTYHRKSREEKTQNDTVEPASLVINRVILAGNKKTHDRIILRELTLQPGDSVDSDELEDILLKDKNKVYNLRLFNTVEIRKVEVGPNRVDLLVELNERWYTFPNPIFELSDRNFNEWWETFNHDLRRVNYGLRIYQFNFRGRNETLRLTGRWGFSRKIDLTYTIPNLDRKQKQGIAFAFSYSQPKNVAYFTEGHQLQFLRSRETIKTSWSAGVTYSYRKSFYETHALGFEYQKSNVTDTILLLNPNYFKNGSTRQRFETLTYSFTSDHRDIHAYPLHGHQTNFFVRKIGLGFTEDADMLDLNLTHARYLDLKNGFFLSNFSSLYQSTSQSQAYSLYTGLGYRKQFIRGYEVFVIEGSRFFLNKTTFKKRILNRNWQFSNVRKQFSHFPLAIYLKSYADIGYVENFRRYEELTINNTLSNRLLVGVGGGFDVVMMYDMILRFEYSFTREGTNGFFFNLKREF